MYIYIYVFITLRESPPPSCVLAVGFGIPCLHSVPESYTIEMHIFGLNLRSQDGLSWGLVGAKLGQVGSLGGGLGAMLGSKIGLGSPLGVIFRLSWAQEPIKTPKGEVPEPIKTPQSEEMRFQDPPRASLGPPNLEPKSNINQHKMKQTNDNFLYNFGIIFSSIL